MTAKSRYARREALAAEEDREIRALGRPQTHKDVRQVLERTPPWMAALLKKHGRSSSGGSPPSTAAA